MLLHLYITEEDTEMHGLVCHSVPPVWDWSL